MIKQKAKMDFVEVLNEPSHKEVYSNEFTRVYIADIRPGESTMYHRHTVDTIYIVLEGGWIRTEDAKKGEKYPIVFSGDVSIFEKAKMALSKAIKGEVYMSKGLQFCLKHKSNPTIHRAVASKKNPRNMVMMGIELTD